MAYLVFQWLKLVWHLSNCFCVCKWYIIIKNCWQAYVNYGWGSKLIPCPCVGAQPQAQVQSTGTKFGGKTLHFAHAHTMTDIKPQARGVRWQLHACADMWGKFLSGHHAWLNLLWRKVGGSATVRFVWVLPSPILHVGCERSQEESAEERCGQRAGVN